MRGDPVEKVSKGRGNYVTETDVACEEAILSVIRSEYGEARILYEDFIAAHPDSPTRPLAEARLADLAEDAG